MPDPEEPPPSRSSRTPGQIISLALLVLGLVLLLVVVVIVGQALG